MKRVLIAGIFHETHSFVEGNTFLEDFDILRGDELTAAWQDVSPLAGALVVARECGWTVVPAIDYRTMISPTVADAVIETWWSEFLQYAQTAIAEGLDAIFLVLHGAMASESFPDVEGEVLRRIRSVSGLESLPIGGVTDLHANFSPAMANYSNALVTYRCNPHTDAKEAASRAVRILDSILENGHQAKTVMAQPPIIWSPTGTGTADEPMLSLERMARKLEQDYPELLAVNVHAGFSFTDTPDTGLSFSAVTIGKTQAAEVHLRELCAWAVENKEAGNIVDPPIAQVMNQVKWLAEGKEIPIGLVEPADNVGGGGPGNGTGILRALLEHQIENSGVILADAEAVAEASTWQPGQRGMLSVGGKNNPFDPGPLDLEVELVSLSDGKFDLEDPTSHLASAYGLHIDMGPSAVVKTTGNIVILLTTRKTPPLDLGQWRSQGIEPEKLSVIGIKAAVAYRGAYDPILAHTFRVDTPGPSSSDLRRFSFRNVPRPVYPLDS